ncbi:MAG: hypothetical protein A3B07_01150 [Candidatus Yonathbacteria bacterium RIFCSPLOWO2_01_FULL_43_27]|uniref:26 kDa periplasmic immunogenic protein n=2 Tax=Parcubacteria group TaxID=1794811 RepID=A0A1G2SE41_9BACT|nr:MAG: hypothetical protein UW78_C0009G0018 [Candidatus Azambacteria bacterium GW2011_GWA1_44_9]OHA82711.1 MAG: hypothetical protein A3B07_01150 [Candidatus Yonathbacteria bacterium RIFCSPLOWO2_01_FULL_43_27]
MENNKNQLYQVLSLLALLSAVFVITMIITEIKSYRFIGGGVSATNTISVSGEGEVFASPDIATITFSVRDEAKTVKDAQGKVNTKMKAVLEAIKKLDIADKDIKTQNYSSYPKYEFQEGTVSCLGLNCPPYRPGKQVLVGYEVSQSVTITVRDLDKTNDVVGTLGTLGVTDMQGPNFAIDKEDDLRAEARRDAIKKARAKAETLARDLDVTLVRIVSFSEGQSFPIYRLDTATAKGGESVPSAPTPELPQGQEKITSNVTVTYEIR